MANKNKESRSFPCEIRMSEDNRKMVGHAAVFNQETDIGGWFREMILPGAFTESIGQDDVRALFNHNPDYIMGRNKSGTLTLTEDEKGLRVEIDPPDTQFARDLAVSIERGDISQMSFGFEIESSDDIEWQRGQKGMLDLRKIKRAKLWDVSPVTFPAYEGTDIAMRSHEAFVRVSGTGTVPEESEHAPAVEQEGNASETSARRKHLLKRRI
jgi:hypothetical protein